MARLNVQGLSRKESRLMSAILPDPGNVIVSIDLSAGEPSVTASFSGDTNYRWATVDGVGKAPQYINGLLKIDDIYLMVMSVSPIGRHKIAEAWHKAWPAGTFAQQWVADAEVIKTALKKDRQVHKILVLGIGYGMQPRKMVKQMYENGFDLSLEDAKKFFDAYWSLFPEVRRFSLQLERQLKRDGYIVNPFGYRLTPEPRLGFNYFIQSSVSGIMHVFTAKLFAAAPYARFLTCIHDELLVEIPKVKLDEFRKDKERATDSLNEDLGWNVAIRTGFVAGSCWYTAK